MIGEIPKKDHEVIGLRVAAVDYAEAVNRIQAMARWDRPTLVAAANTHLAAAAYWRYEFAVVMARFDMIVPDGMPLVWCMNAKGAGLKDRVYGPILMGKVLEATPTPQKHFFFGGTPECLTSLQDAVTRRFPGTLIVGTYSPPFRQWDDNDEASFAAAIEASGADFVWIALGGVKQETWIADNIHRFRRGVFLTVGDAFELLAGRRTMAPVWMQRSGLAWLFRLGQEPGRLWKRYLVHNTLFCAAVLLQWVRPARRLPGNRSQGGG